MAGRRGLRGTGAGGAAGADRPFLYYFDAPITAATVDSESDALAAALAGRGLGRGDRIALYLQNMPQFVIGLLAAWKLGATAVPVNPMLKERELRYVLSDSGARAIISLQDLWNEVAAKAAAGTDVDVAITTSPLDYLGGRDVPPPLAGIRGQPTPGALDLARAAPRARRRPARPGHARPGRDRAAHLHLRHHR